MKYKIKGLLVPQICLVVEGKIIPSASDDAIYFWVEANGEKQIVFYDELPDDKKEKVKDIVKKLRNRSGDEIYL